MALAGFMSSFGRLVRDLAGVRGTPPYDRKQGLD
jgi:hypothetical protein